MKASIAREIAKPIQAAEVAARLAKEDAADRDLAAGLLSGIETAIIIAARRGHFQCTVPVPKPSEQWNAAARTLRRDGFEAEVCDQGSRCGEPRTYRLMVWWPG